MKFPDMDEKTLIASPASGNESWGGGRDPSDSPRKSTWLSPRIGRSRIKVDVRISWSPPDNLTLPIWDWEDKVFTIFGVIISFALSLRAWTSHASEFSSSSMSGTKNISFRNSTRTQCISKEYSRWRRFTKLMESWLVFRRNKMIFHHWTTELLVLCMVLQIAVHMVFSHLTGGREHLANNSNIP